MGKNLRTAECEGFDGKKGQFCTCNIFTSKQCRNELCKMAHLMPTEMEKEILDSLVNMLSTGVAEAVTKLEGGKKVMNIRNNPE